MRAAAIVCALLALLLSAEARTGSLTVDASGKGFSLQVSKDVNATAAASVSKQPAAVSLPDISGAVKQAADVKTAFVKQAVAAVQGAIDSKAAAVQQAAKSFETKAAAATSAAATVEVNINKKVAVVKEQLTSIVNQTVGVFQGAIQSKISTIQKAADQMKAAHQSSSPASAAASSTVSIDINIDKKASAAKTNVTAAATQAVSSAQDAINSKVSAVQKVIDQAVGRFNSMKAAVSQPVSNPNPSKPNPSTPAAVTAAQATDLKVQVTDKAKQAVAAVQGAIDAKVTSADKTITQFMGAVQSAVDSKKAAVQGAVSQVAGAGKGGSVSINVTASKGTTKA